MSNNDPIMKTKMFNETGKVAHGAEQSMQQHKRFSGTLLYKTEFVFLFDLIIHRLGGRVNPLLK